MVINPQQRRALAENISKSIQEIRIEEEEERREKFYATSEGKKFVKLCKDIRAEQEKLQILIRKQQALSAKAIKKHKLISYPDPECQINYIYQDVYAIEREILVASIDSADVKSLTETILAKYSKK